MITVVGVDAAGLDDAARAAVAAASLVVGGRRQLRAAPVPAGARVVELGPLAPALDLLGTHDGDAVVLASGDPGFFGVLRSLRERGLDCVVRPGVSSVALAFARAGLSWDDACVVSAHGRDPRPAINVCRAHRKVAVLTGPGCGPAEIGAAVAGWPRRLIVAERLGTPDERITACPPADAALANWADPNVVLVLGEPPAGSVPGWCWPPAARAAGWALDEAEFDQRDAVITKAEVRALALARLGPGPGALIWDIGAGTGSVGIECARLGAAVIAVERDPVRCERVRANAARHDVDVRVVHGTAPAALGGLPLPDAVFAGGGGPEVVAAAAARHPARIVVALAALERTGPAREALVAAGYQVDAVLLQASRLRALPGGSAGNGDGGAHRLDPVNPVFLVCGTLPGAVRQGTGR